MRKQLNNEKQTAMVSRVEFSIKLPEKDTECAVCHKPLIIKRRLYNGFWVSPRGPVCDECSEDVKDYLVVSYVQISGKLYRVFFRVTKDQRTYVFERAESKDDVFLVGWFRTRMEGWISVGDFSLLRQLGLPEPEYPLRENNHRFSNFPS